MAIIHSNGGKIAYGVKHYILDQKADLEELKLTTAIKPGTTVFIIETSKYYMLNSKYEWIEINPFSTNGSNGGGDNDDPFDNIYDGGSIDGSDPL